MARKFYTIDDLYVFCKENRFEFFSSEQQGAPLIIQSFGVFEADKTNDDGLMKVKLKSCHTGKNRNRSGITDENMNKYKHTFKGRPILGAIYQTDTGEYEFRAHDMKIVENGDETEIEYIEQPIGVISQLDEPYLEYDKDEDKNYLMVNGTIFSDYSRAAEILERRKTCKCSVEIAVEELSYNCDEDYLSIDKFRFSGVTILGYEQDGVTEIQEGMKGSKITIDDFSVNKNSMFSAECQNKLIETLEKLNMTLESFSNTTNSEKGGEKVMDKFNELLAKYGKTADEVTFEYENLSDEELEVAFEEAFGEVESEVEEVTTEEEVEEEHADEEVAVEETEEEVVVEETTTEEEVQEVETVTIEEGFTLQYKLSHEDIRSALYGLLAATSEDSYYYTWIIEVYDNEFIYQDCMEDKFYRQNYAKDGDNVSLGESKVEVFNEWLSKEEKDALEALKADYAVLKSFKENYEAAELKAQKDAIFAREEYAVLVDDESFKALVSESEKYSVEEVEAKLKTIFADHVIKAGAFSAKSDSESKTKTIGFNFTEKPSKKKQAYGGLFAKDE